MPRPKKAESRGSTKPHLIDTNVILRYLIGDDPSKADQAVALMTRVERSEEVVEITDEVLTESVWTLESFYKVPRNETAQKLAAMLNFPGVRMRARDIALSALQLYASSNADFVDCFLAARSKARSLAIYTFDKTDFKKLNADWENPEI